MRIHQDFEGLSRHVDGARHFLDRCAIVTTSTQLLRTSLAGRARRGCRSAAIGGIAQAAITTTASLSYSRKLECQGFHPGIRSALRATATAASIEGLEDPESTYASAVIGYDRNIGARLFGGVQGGVRRLFQNGPDPDTDFNATVYLRYRLGDL